MGSLVQKLAKYAKNDADFVLSALAGAALMDHDATTFGVVREPLFLAGTLAMFSGGYESASRFYRNFYAMAAPIAFFWTQTGEAPFTVDITNKAIALGCCVAAAYLEKRPQSPYYAEIGGSDETR